MRFTSKMDRTFALIYGIIVVICIGSFGLIFVLDDGTMIEKVVSAAIGIICVGAITWLLFDIQYEFKEQELYLRAGFLYTRIPYKSIEGYRLVEGFLDVGSGFNLLSNTKALAIMSQKVMLGEVKISPTDRDAFIAELQKRMTRH